MRRLIILGNCVAQRLASLLGTILDKFNPLVPPERRLQLVSAPPVYNLATFATTPKNLADLACQCDVVFTQPLFNFGPLNTASLASKAGIKLHTFSAPNFDAYFPDVVHAPSFAEAETFSPPLEWHSRIFLECKAGNVPIENVEDIYLNHPLFHAHNMARALDRSWALYEQRDQNVEIGTLELARRHYASEILFFTWKHPADRVIAYLLKEMLARLGLSSGEIENSLRHIPFRERPDKPGLWSEWGFGFNSWPVVCRHHTYFNFSPREFFRIAGKEIDILTAAIAWYNYYDQHPQIFSMMLKHMLACKARERG